MEDNTNFEAQLETAIKIKTEWFNSEKLVKVLEDYRLIFTCVKNLNETLEKKSIIVRDPYKFDHKITEISNIDSDDFTEQELPQVLSTRLSQYEQILDYLCTYFRFSVETMPIQIIKKLTEFNGSFMWSRLSTESQNSNTRGLAMALNKAKTNAQAVTVSLINDSVSKSSQSIEEISSILAEVADFQREFYKWQLRRDLFNHPEFNREKAFSSAENELAEIKRLYPKVIGKKSFYNDLVQEIINEDQGASRESARAALFKKLELPAKVSKSVKKGPTSRDMLMAAVVTLGAVGPVLQALEAKLSDDFELLFFEKKTFLKRIIAAIKKSLGVAEKERVCNLSIVNKKTDTKTTEKINVADFINEIDHKKRLYSAISMKGAEYNKLAGASEVSVLTFLSKQVTENNRLYTLMDAFDEHFKASIDTSLKPKIKGLKIDLSSYRNAIINLNKKREEYVSFVEEAEQMKKLGITNEN